ncbi:MAG: hypothetical protein JSS20_19320, partial [Proteobacteria bacterium]|nr:hypothetical protein [Pseudomonadota bacterium]
MQINARRFATIAQWPAAFGVGVALSCVGALAILGPLRTGLFGLSGIGLSVHVDVLGAVMLLLVSFVGLVVVRYSRNYLDGDPAHVRFTCWLLLTLASVQLLILSGNLAMLLGGWIATSLSLNKLLLFCPERPAAQRAALKKFVASRIGDLCLLIATGLLFAQFGTLEIADINATARAAAGSSMTLSTALAGFLLVMTAMLKSAQLPLLGW